MSRRPFNRALNASENMEAALNFPDDGFASIPNLGTRTPEFTADHMFDRLMDRRCERCQHKFKTKFVGNTQCPECWVRGPE